MVLSEEDVAALRADLERAQRENEAAEEKKREYEAKLERLRRERSLGTSFDGLGSGSSADRRGTAASTMGPMWTRGVSTGGGLGEDSPYVPRHIVQKYPVECPPYVYIAWERRFEFILANQGLRHTISPDAPEIAVISCINDAYPFGHFGEALVTDHRRVWGYISEATAGAPFVDRLYECHSVSDAFTTMRSSRCPFIQPSGICLWRSWRELNSWGTKTPKISFPAFPASRQRCMLSGSKKANRILFRSFSASSRNVTMS